MLIRVDLPAPFSPTMPWTVPAATRSDTSQLACTAPNRLSIPASSMAGAEFMARRRDVRSRRPRSARAGAVGHVVVLLDGAVDDAGLGLLDGRLHGVGDQRPVVLDARPVASALGQAQALHARAACTVLRVQQNPVMGAG